MARLVFIGEELEWIRKQDDFDNSWYADYYVYFIYGAAVAFKRDYTFKSKYINQVLALIRNIANPSTKDPYFPAIRHKHWYDGHPWTGGIDPMTDPINQESTSEAVNGYYAVYLLGLSIVNQSLADLGRVLLVTEIRTAQKYWQIKNTSIYPLPFADNKIVGILWSSKFDYATWFGSNV